MFCVGKKELPVSKKLVPKNVLSGEICILDFGVNCPFNQRFSPHHICHIRIKELQKWLWSVHRVVVSSNELLYCKILISWIITWRKSFFRPCMPKFTHLKHWSDTGWQAHVDDITLVVAAAHSSPRHQSYIWSYWVTAFILCFIPALNDIDLYHNFPHEDIVSKDQREADSWPEECL